MVLKSFILLSVLKFPLAGSGGSLVALKQVPESTEKREGSHKCRASFSASSLGCVLKPWVV